MTVKELKEIINRLDDNFTVTVNIARPVPEDELPKRSYKYPYDYEDVNIESFDIGYSDKNVSLLCSASEL